MASDQKIRVAVLFGGRSGEHEVSLVSATSVIDNLDKEKYEIIPIGITKEGKWVAGTESMQLLKSNHPPKESNIVIPAEPNSVMLEQVNGVSAAIASSISKMDSIASPTASLQNDSQHIDVIFPVLHGPYGEDGTVQGFLELAGLPYVGCGVLASAVAMDKVMQKKVFQAEGLTQVPYVWFWRTDWAKNKEKYINEIETLGYPVFVKPANLGSSVGINKAHNQEELIKYIAEASAYDRKVLVEKGVEKAREIECSVLGNQDIKTSLPGEIIPSNEFYDYDAKYVDGKSDAKIPADLPTDIVKIIQDTAIRAFRALSGEGLARVDFFLTSDNEIYINEVNTMPGFTSISMYPKLWEATGLGYSALLDELINLALMRAQEKNNLKIFYEPKAAWYA